MAVTAATRKLVMIAWQLLTKGEPYRYASPEPTQRKLSRLRIAATGQRRPTGPARGGGSPARQAASAGARTIKPLSQVYAEEGLPELRAMPAGEVRHVRDSGVEDYVRSIGQRRVDRRGPGSGFDREALPRAVETEGSAPRAVRDRRPDPAAQRSRPLSARPNPVGRIGSSEGPQCGRSGAVQKQ